MAKSKAAAVTAPPINVNGTFYTVIKASHLLYEALEIVVENGVCTSSRIITRAPDATASAVGRASAELWNVARLQYRAGVLGE